MNTEKLPKQVANLLAQQRVEQDKDFFWKVSQECEKLGYSLCAEQRGISGTYIYMRKDK